ncbi:MAG: YybH family protein, partial [Solirubrobacteraceae bacterium]
MPSPLEDAARASYRALNDMLGGDVTPMLELWLHADDVTYMSPFGELLVGWDPVRASWQAQADQLLGGHLGPEELHHFASDTLGFVAGFE